MIRETAAASLIGVVVLVLYLPAAHPPEWFVERLRDEHELNDRVWGTDRALRILERTIAASGAAHAVSPIPATLSAAPPPPAIDAVVARQMAEARERLFAGAYFRSLQALFALALYRAVSLAEWLPVLAAFIGASLFDGAVRRKVKSKEFVQHSAELFGLHAGLGVIALCGALVALFVPLTVHPYALGAVPLLVGVLGGQAVANFHARG